MTTNASPSAATLAATLASARKGTFTGLITQKKGTERGRGSAKLTYGDDVVHVVLVTGFNYKNLVTKSLTRLLALDLDAVEAEFATRGIVDGDGGSVGRLAIEEAVKSLKDSFEATLAGTNESTTDHVYEPVLVDGETVAGCRVYKCVAGDATRECHCRDCTSDAKAPKDGTIYLQGLKIGETVLTPAPNGPVPASKSRADVVAKNILRARLPVGRYVSYSLEAGENWILRAGFAAATASDKAGIALRAGTEAEVMACLAE